MSSSSREKRGRFSAEVRERAIRWVQGQTSQGAAITAIARSSGARRKPCGAGCAKRSATRACGPDRRGRDEDRIKALERENRELERANEILRKASAFLAAAELDRPTR